MRLLTTVLLVALLMAALVAPASAGYPYWDEGAHTNEEQAERLDLLRSERRERRVRLKDTEHRISVLKDRRHRLKQSIRAHTFLLHFIKPTSAFVEWLYPLRLCESTNNYQAVSASGTYRGAYQFSISTFAGAYGYADPIAAPWYVQDLRAVEVRIARGVAPWPECG